MDISRKQTNTVRAGAITIGGKTAISIQTMWKDPLVSVDTGLVQRIGTLQSMGCDLLRFAVPDEKTAVLLGELQSQVGMPLVADIHFDHKIALICIDSGIAKIRINPGNIGAAWKVREIVQAAGSSATPVRIGVNGGSLPAKHKNNRDLPSAMVSTAEEEIEILESFGFSDIVISLKSSDPMVTLEANRIFSKRFSYPLHIGVTEAGPLIAGVVRSTYTVSKLLTDGIGDTIRISLSDDPENEIIAAREILGLLRLRKSGVNIISCPRCGRNGFDVQGFLSETRQFLYTIEKPLTVAIMGCEVNGPEEAKHADIGITGSGNKVLIFRAGKIISRVEYAKAAETFKEELRKLLL
jgi:(E)-4-hydroxy-3-methylbut-2-enyl-diphosphate synthase